MTPFEPNTYQIQLGKLRGVAKSRVLPKKLGPDGKDIFACPMARCPLWVSAFRLTDVRKVPSALRGNASWACDGCIAGWVRDMKLWAPGRIVSEAVLAEAFGAPADVIANLNEGLLRRRSRNPQIDSKFKALEE